MFGGPTNVGRPIVSQERVCVDQYVNMPKSALLVSSLFGIISHDARLKPSQGRLCACPRAGRRRLSSLLSVLSVNPGRLVKRRRKGGMQDFDHCRCCLLSRTVGKGD